MATVFVGVRSRFPEVSGTAFLCPTEHLALPIETAEQHQDEQMACWPCRLLLRKIYFLLHLDREKDENKEIGKFCY